jgi:uncharacterized protein YjiS (DUF1127 family)
MPAENRNHGPINAMMRLVLLVRAWRQRRAARRRIRWCSFMSLSDRALADIGVRRADVRGAMVGVTPLRRSAIEHAPEGTIRQLRPRPALTVVANDLSAAA